jgi:hypothetical protein
MKTIAKPVARRPNVTGDTLQAFCCAFPSRLGGVFCPWWPRRRFDIALVKLSSPGDARRQFL